MRRGFFILALVGLVVFWVVKEWGFKDLKGEEVRTVVRVDTVVRRDTVVRIEPRAVGVVRVRYDTIRVISLHHDTVAGVVAIEQKSYRDSNYYAVVSGYNARLDTIRVFNSERVITKMVNTTKVKKRVFNVGVVGGLGYGFMSKQIEPFVGVGLGVNLFP